MRVALKYCGGCDPAYERVDYFEAIKQAAGERISWCRLDEDGFEAILLICGCESACPEEEMPASKPQIVCKDDKAQPEVVVEAILSQ